MEGAFAAIDGLTNLGLALISVAYGERGQSREI